MYACMLSADMSDKELMLHGVFVLINLLASVGYSKLF